jgi:uncharacterized caspase-like protein
LLKKGEWAAPPGKVALDAKAPNSPFSAPLSRHIGTPGLEVQQMLTRVRAEVVGSTKDKQVPWSNFSLLGAVILPRSEDGQVPAVTALGTSARDCAVFRQLPGKHFVLF